MGRPRHADSEVTVSHIIDAALAELAATTSVQPPSLRPVAARAGVSLGTIQYYFDSKEELLEACLDEYYNRLSQLGAELMAKSFVTAAGREQIEQAILALYDFCYRERALLALRIATNAQRGELHPRRQRDFMGGLARQTATALLPHIEVDEEEARYSIQAISAIVVRFALMSESERTHLTDLKGEQAQTAIRAYVVRAGRRLMRPGDG